VRSRHPLVRFQQAFERGFERLRLAYQRLLTTLVQRRALFIPVFLLSCLAALLLAPWLGQDFFPSTDSGQILLHVRAKTGTRIEETARLVDLIEDAMRQTIPPDDLDNIGFPYSVINYMYSTSGLLGAGDADILVSLKATHRPTADYVRALRQRLPAALARLCRRRAQPFPADMVMQTLNFGLPAPVDMQIEGADLDGNRQVANQLLTDLRQVPGLTDLRIQQPFDYPTFEVAVDRTKASQGGFTMRDVASSVLVSLSGSFQTTPTFFLDW
jgi:multidrug efflux pump subunit AcrB